MPATSGPVEVLLVEDNPNDVQLALHALRRHELVGDRVRVVRDGEEALDFLFGVEDQPKVVLLDLKLPKIDGLEVLRRIKADSRTRATPIVVLTSSREQRDVLESYGAGVNSYIVKPVDFEQFDDVVRQLGSYWLALNHPPSG